MTSEYNLLKHVYLSSETLLNLAGFDYGDEDLIQKLNDFRNHIDFAPKNLISTMKFIKKNGWIEDQDVIKLLENRNLSAYELFHLMTYNIYDLNFDSTIKDDLKNHNKLVCEIGSSNPVFNKADYADFLVQVSDTFPKEVSSNPLSSKNILYRVIKNNKPNFAAMESICEHPNTDHDLITLLAKEFYLAFEGRYIASYDQQIETISKFIKEQKPSISEVDLKVHAIILVNGHADETTGAGVHLKLKEIDEKVAKYWQVYYNVSAFDD